jgi:hypothetical protein
MPSMFAMSSCVMTNEFEGRRSRLYDSQRHSCCPIERGLLGCRNLNPLFLIVLLMVTIRVGP